jgi:N-acetylglutamate synthase-like GNAT family acetyltransferase
VIVKPATEKLVKEYYGFALPLTLRGYVVINDDGEVVGVAGFLRKSKGVMAVFSEGEPEAYEDKRMVVKLARYMMRLADDNGWTLIADPDQTKPTAEHFLSRLGFEPDDEGFYTRWPVSQQPPPT